MTSFQLFSSERVLVQDLFILLYTRLVQLWLQKEKKNNYKTEIYLCRHSSVMIKPNCIVLLIDNLHSDHFQEHVLQTSILKFKSGLRTMP